MSPLNLDFRFTTADAVLQVCSSATVLLAVNCSSTFTFYVMVADIRSTFMMHAGESRRWFMRRIHALKSFVEEKGGSILVVVLVTSGQVLRGLPHYWGVVL